MKTRDPWRVRVAGRIRRCLKLAFNLNGIDDHLRHEEEGLGYDSWCPRCDWLERQ